MANRTVKIEILGEDSGVRRAFNSAAEAAGGFASRLRSVVVAGAKLAAGAVVAAGTALVGMAIKAARTGDEVAKTSTKLGISAEALQEWRFAADRSGVSSSSLERGIGRLNQRIGRAIDGNEKYGKAFDKLGVSLTDAGGNIRDTDDVLQDTLRSLAAIEEPALRSAAASEVFGTKMARDLMPMLEEGSEGLEALRQEARDLGIVMSEDSVRAAEKFQDAWTNLTARARGFALQIGARVLPSLLQLVEGIEQHVLPIVDRFVDFLGPKVDWAVGLARDAVISFIQAIRGDWVDSDEIVGIHRIFGLLGQSLRTLVEIFEALREGRFSDVFSLFFDQIRRNLGLVRDLGRPLVEAILTQLGSLVDRVREIDWRGVARSIGDALLSALGTGVDLVQRLVSWFGDQVDRIEWSEVGEAIWDRIQSAFAAAISVGRGAIDLAARFAEWVRAIEWSEVGSAIWSRIQSAFSAAISVGEDAIDLAARFATWVRGIEWTEVGEAIWGKIQTAFSAAIALGEEGLDLAGRFVTFIREIEWSEVGEAIWDKIQAAFSAAISLGEEGLDLAGRFVTFIREIEWSEVGEAIWDKIQSAWAAAISAGESAVEIGTNIKDWLGEQLEGIEWGELWESITSGLDDALEKLAELDSSGTVGQALEWLGTEGAEKVDNFGEAIREEVLPRLDGWKDSLQEIADVFGDEWEPMLDTMNRELPIIAEFLKNITIALGAIGLAVTGTEGERLPSWAQHSIANVKSLFFTITSIMDAFNTVVRFVRRIADGEWREAIDEVIGFHERMQERIFEIFRTLGIDLEGWVESLNTRLTNGWELIRENTIGRVQELYEGATERFEQLRVDVTSRTEEAVENVVSAVSELPSRVFSFIDEMTGGVLSRMVQFALEMIGAGQEVVDSFRDGLVSRLSRVEQAARDIVSSVKDPIKGAVSEMAQIGRDILQGFYNGLTDNALVSSIRRAGEALGDLIPDSVRDRLSMRSPSQVMIEIGEQILAGLAEGLDRSDALSAAATQAGRTVVQDIQFALAEGTRSLDELAGHLHFATLPAIMEARHKIDEELASAIRRGADTEELEQQLAHITQIFDAWAERNEMSVSEAIDRMLAAAAEEQQRQERKEKLEALHQDLVDGWNGMLDQFSSIIDGSLTERLELQLAELRQRLKVAMAADLPQDVIEGIKAGIDATKGELRQAGQIMGAAIETGVIQGVKPISDAVIEEVQELSAKLGGVTGHGRALVDAVINGMETGRFSLEQAAQMLPDSVIPRLEEVKESLLIGLQTALIEGSDPTGFKQNIDQITQLLGMLRDGAVSMAANISEAWEAAWAAAGMRRPSGGGGADLRAMSAGIGGGGGGLGLGSILGLAGAERDAAGPTRARLPGESALQEVLDTRTLDALNAHMARFTFKGSSIGQGDFLTFRPDMRNQWYVALRKSLYSVATGFPTLTDVLRYLEGTHPSKTLGYHPEAFEHLKRFITRVPGSPSSMLAGGGRATPIGLEHGGVFTSPTLAMIGENPRTTPEVVSPQKLMLDTFLKALEKFFGEAGQRQGITVNQVIHGMQPGDVERETRRAIRSVALNWGIA